MGIATLLGPSIGTVFIFFSALSRLRLGSGENVGKGILNRTLASTSTQSSNSTIKLQVVNSIAQGVRDLPDQSRVSKIQPCQVDEFGQHERNPANQTRVFVQGQFFETGRQHVGDCTDQGIVFEFQFQQIG